MSERAREIVRGERRHQPAPIPEKADRPETRRICIARRDDISHLLYQFRHSLDSDGERWTFTCETRKETDRLLTFLRLRGIHGTIRQSAGRSFPERNPAGTRGGRSTPPG